ncbi:hypothetical protein [Cysteiniphilum marinum]|uniref:hypothetical protein n=1 Tax=Cysteiniphilum marinum TaxID=2774191 RepID=UPI00193A4A0E|nr:hypothetical protein [Cysteiniphilum marinum]
MQRLTKKALTSSLFILLAGSSYGSLSISDYQPDKITLSEARNGNEVADINNMPLDGYLQSIYSGYTVKFDQMDNEKVTIKPSDKIPNNAADILSFLAKSYQLSFALNNQEHTITVSPSNNVSYQSYHQGLKALNKERDELARDYEQKTKNYDNLAAQNSALYQYAQALSDSGDALNVSLRQLLKNGDLSNQDSAQVKALLAQWQETQQSAPYRLDEQGKLSFKALSEKSKEASVPQEKRIIDDVFVVSPFMTASEKENILDIYNKNKALVENDKIKDSEFINAFIADIADIAELNNDNLSVYRNEKTKKTAIAYTENNAQLLTNNKVFYVFKDESVQAVLSRWASVENITFDLSDTPEELLNVKMPDNHIFTGVVLSQDKEQNAVGELINQAIVLLKQQPEKAKTLKTAKIEKTEKSVTK